MKLELFNQLTGARYATPPMDGAQWKCTDCGDYFSFSKVKLVRVPAHDKPQIMCNCCIDDDWLEIAKNCGELEF